jgi:dinuclear metal center YbgI/SA1388 family protein
MTARLGDWIEVLDGIYEPSWAEDWDAVGLVAGDPDSPVARALFTVDVTDEVVDEAERVGAQLIVAHHPLYLSGTTAAETGPKGRRLARLVRSRVALFTVHTNADSAAPGVSDALGAGLGMRDLQPLHPTAADDGVKLVVFVPTGSTEQLVDALSAAGAGGVGDYTRCHWVTEGTGSFVPQPGANPAVGRIGEPANVAESRLELLVPPHRVAEVVRALRATHPYEEPAYDLVPTMLDHGRGHGRVGDLDSSMAAGDFAALVAAALPRTPAEVRLAGDSDRPVRRIAVCGGAGDDFVDDAIRAGADIYVTADLRHHVTAEAVERGLLMVDAGHWATEWPWLRDAASRTASALEERGHTVSTAVSSLVTDPWGGVPQS